MKAPAPGTLCCITSDYVYKSVAVVDGVYMYLSDSALWLDKDSLWMIVAVYENANAGSDRMLLVLSDQGLYYVWNAYTTGPDWTPF